VLAQRLASAVDHAPLHWRCVSDKQTVRLMTPIATDPDKEAQAAGVSGAHSGGSSFRSLAVSTFPVSAAVVLSFLWSMDCYKLLDPLSVLEARELAPHASAPSKAKYSYLSLELKSTTTTTSNTAGTGTASTAAATNAAAQTQPTAANATALANGDAPATNPTAPGSSITSTIAGAGAASGVSLTRTSSARVDFVLLNSWRRRLDGSYVLLQQSVPEEGIAEINAPKKFQKGCIRGSMGGPGDSAASARFTPGSLDARRHAFQLATGGVSGWVLRPFYVDGVSPACEVSYLSCTSFTARMGSWLGPELERRTAQTVVALKGRLRAIMGAHPLVQLALPAPGSADNDPAAIAAHAHQQQQQQHAAHSAHAHGHHLASHLAGPLHFSLSQPVPVSLVHAVSAAGVQTTPHPRGKPK